MQFLVIAVLGASQEAFALVMAELRFAPVHLPPPSGSRSSSVGLCVGRGKVPNVEQSAGSMRSLITKSVFVGLVD